MKIPKRLRGKFTAPSEQPNKTYCQYESTSRRSGWEKTEMRISGLPDDAAFKSIIVPCATPECPTRKAALEHLGRAEASVLHWHQANGTTLSPERAIYELATALMGNRESVLGDPANFCKLGLVLAFDGHWAPTDTWPLSQEEMARVFREKGLEEVLGRRLTRADALKLAEGDAPLLQAIAMAEDVQFHSLDMWFGTFTVCQVIHSGSYQGDVTVTHDHSEDLNRSLGVTAQTLRPFAANQERVELNAGAVLRQALMARYGLRLGSVTKHEPPPGDIRIGGLDHLVEHTMVDSRPWQHLSKAGDNGRATYSHGEPPAGLFEEWLSSLLRKGPKKYPAAVRSNLILLLDTGPIHYRPDWVKQFAFQFREEIDSLGYVEVWLVCPAADEAIRLSSSSLLEEQ